MASKARPYPASVLKGRGKQRTFDGRSCPQIAFPLGGIGAGGFCISAYGGLQDFSIAHKPQISAMPDGHGVAQAMFGLLRIPGHKAGTRLLEGPMPPQRIWDQGLKGQGYRVGGYEGLPRFAQSTFRGEFPFARVDLKDKAVPLDVRITAWSPFIPGDDKNSCIPAAILEYTLRNRTKKPIDYELSFHMSDPTASGPRSCSKAIPGVGVAFQNTHPADTVEHASACFCVIGPKAQVKGSWFRGSWFDSVTALWQEVSAGRLQTSRGSREGDDQGRNGGSILIRGTLPPKEQTTIPIAVTWYWPTIRIASHTGSMDTPRVWKTWYATKWRSARDVAAYVRRGYAKLRARTEAFRKALFGCTLPDYVLDAVSANLGILRSPTVLRGQDGGIWGWEGCFCTAGCCPGSCTHVWNYAQAMANLFPKLERTLREQEYLRSMDERGHVNFRLPTPDQTEIDHNGHAAADGQLGGIVKVYREWQISGNRAWLKRMYPLAKRSIDYCIETWDPGRTGALIEPHHNTYDIEFWGADGMCTGFYCAALTAIAAIARAAGQKADAPFYEGLARKAAARLDTELFNGKYYDQHVQSAGLRERSHIDRMAKVTAQSTERDRLLKREGPPYQYGAGCLADGVIGPWLADLAGLGTPQSAGKIRKHLKSVFRHNFKADLSAHPSTQRPGYAMGSEAGLLLCTWPNGGKPTLPFPYSDEVWTGIEYEVASYLIRMGLVNEGLTIVRGVRDRHDGLARNPWCEYECGNYYARAMSSYALLWACSGLRYSAPTRTLHLSPRLKGAKRGKTRVFQTFLATDGAFGTVRLTDGTVTILLTEGKLKVNRLILGDGPNAREIPWKIEAVAGRPKQIRIPTIA